MSNAVEGLQPPLVWKYFAEIAKIPRGSKHEEKITKYVLETAKKLGLAAKADKLGNVVVKKPASAGRERAKSVALRGHLDMVCEKNKDKVHDFSKDPIELVPARKILSFRVRAAGPIHQARRQCSSLLPRQPSSPLPAPGNQQIAQPIAAGARGPTAHTVRPHRGAPATP